MKKATNSKKPQTVKQYCKHASVRVQFMPARSQWSKGVKWYALLLLAHAADIADDNEIFLPSQLKDVLLGGAADFSQLSTGGGIIPFTRAQIEPILCTKSERGKLSLGDLMTCQARAMMQAYYLLRDDLKNIEL